MSQIDIISEDVFEGESYESYGVAIHKALYANKIKSDASHIPHIVIFGMRFENGKFKISIRIFVTMLVIDDKTTDVEANILRQKTILEAYRIRSQFLKTNNIIDAYDDFDHIIHQFTSHDDVIISFNNGSINNHIRNYVDEAWVISSNTLAYQDIYSAIDYNLNLDGWAEVNLYAQPVDDISLIIPENTGFTRHFVNFYVTSKLHEMGIEMRNSFKEHLRRDISNNNINPNHTPTNHSAKSG